MFDEQLLIYCGCAWYEIVPEEVKTQVLKSLRDAGVKFVAVADLCKMAAGKDPVLKEWAGADCIRIVACFPRAVRSLFDFAGAKLPEDALIYNMRSQTAEEIIAELLADSVAQDPTENVSLEKEGDWTPWFPVIDYDRCVNCKQCLNFCLFGVYALSESGKVEVDEPANCKTNCPACARVCPEAAIIFPKYKDSPINGDKVDEEAFRNADKSKVLADLMDGDVHEIIRNRTQKRKRFAAGADSHAPDNRKAQRLADLQEQLDIPQEVIDSLSGGNSKPPPPQNDCPNAAFCDDDCSEKGTDTQHE